MDPETLINADFRKRVVLDTNAEPWTASPEAGVERKLLDRVGGESARATSLVRYAPGSSFGAHEHGGGEEFLVLEGVFLDEHGEYGPGTYVRNPPGSRHRPYSREGCVLFVKLRQFAPGDNKRVVIDTAAAPWSAVSPSGLSRLVLHQHGAERVSLVRFAPGARVVDDPHPDGEELLVLEGVLSDQVGAYPARTWLRDPPGSGHAPFSEGGCLFYVKKGGSYPMA